MADLLRENAHPSCSREQLLVELIDWCHSLTVMELEGDAPLFQATGDKAEQFAKSLDSQRANVREFLAALQHRLETATNHIEQQLGSLDRELSSERDQNLRLIAARDALKTGLTAVESRLAETQQRLAETQQRLNDLQNRPVVAKAPGGSESDFERRYQMALEDIHQEKEKNVELQQQIAKLRSELGKFGKKHNWLDWETEKQRIVAALEADSFGDDEAKKTERMGIEEVLRMTDEVIASKDREIRELKRQLEEQMQVIADGPIPEAAPSPIQGVLDQDAVIQEERERLQTLQKEWREKLRQAEVDISLERAKIARERADLEEQIRLVKDTLAESGAQPEQTARGRWLAQLGLTAADREPSRRPRP